MIAKRFRFRSVRRRLLAGALLTILAAVFVTTTSLFVFDVRKYREESANDIASLAALKGLAAPAALEFADPNTAGEHLSALRAEPSIRAAALYNARGVLFASYLRPGIAREELPSLPEAREPTIEGDRIFTSQRIVHRGEIAGTVYLSADLGLHERVVNYVEISIGVAVVSVLMALWLASSLNASLTRPIVEIASVARRVVESRDYSVRARQLTEDEIGTLAIAFNDMLSEIERRTSELQASTRELDRLNETLEKRVRDRTDQLEESNRQLEAFSYSVSHDLRAPLRAIDGFSQALIEDHGKDVSEGVHAYLSRIRGATLRMSQLIDDLLNLSRISRKVLSPEEVDLSAMGRQVLADLAQREPARKVRVEVWDGMVVHADARLLRVALENLLGNAWKFTGRTADAHIEFGILRDRDASTWFVRDNGAGFDMRYAEKLFDAFQRLHGADEFPGTGIGLATVQRIVHRHGGRIWAHSEPNRGTTFYFTVGTPADAG
jgi:signal transduction histidine kinase